MNFEKKLLFIDVETKVTDDAKLMVAIGNRHPLLAAPIPLALDGRLKTPEKIEEDRVAKEAKAIANFTSHNAAAQAAAMEEFRKTALSASAGGRLFSIAAAVGEDPIKVYDSRVAGEAAMLEQFFRDLSCVTIDERRGARYLDSGLPPLERPIVCAHHASFDIDFIWHRAKILGVSIPAWWPKNVPSYASEKVYDTMVQWAGLRDRISLNSLCKLLGLPGKGWVDGSGVQDLLDAGRGDEVLSYNVDDVRRLRSVYRKIVGLRPLDGDIIGLGGVPEEAPVAVAVPMVTTISTIDPYSLFSDPLADDPMAGMPIDMTELADERDM